MLTRNKRQLSRRKHPYSRKALLETGRQRSFTGPSLSQIAFPLGGIGTGTISLGGRGNLRDWEIFNRPAKGKDLPMTFFAVWAKPRNEQPAARILERKFLPPYADCRAGLERGNLGGVSRLDEAVFRGEYPFAFLSFRDAGVPLRMSLEAFNPFIPLNVEDSSIPVAIFNWTFKNPLSKPVALSLLATMTNPIGWQNIGVETSPFPDRLNQLRRDELIQGLWFTAPELPEEDPNFGTAALASTWDEIDVQTRLYRGGWWDSAHVLWDDFSEDGRLESLIESEYDSGVKPKGSTQRGETGAIAMHASLPPGGSGTLPGMIAWDFPYLKSFTPLVIFPN